MKIIIILVTSILSLNANASLLDIINSGLVKKDAKGYFLSGSDDERLSVSSSTVCYAKRLSDGTYTILPPKENDKIFLHTKPFCDAITTREDVAEILNYMSYEHYSETWTRCKYIHLSNHSKFDNSCG